MSKNGAQVAMEESAFVEMFKKSVEEIPNPRAKPALWVNHVAGSLAPFRDLLGKLKVNSAPSSSFLSPAPSGSQDCNVD